MSPPRTGPLRRLSTVAGAMAITAVSLWLMGVLNAPAAPDLPLPRPARTVLIQGPKTQALRDPQSTPEPEPEPEPQVMTVDLDLPAPTPEPIELLDLPLAFPAIAMASVLSPPSSSRSHGPLGGAPGTVGGRGAGAGLESQPPTESAGNPIPRYPESERQQGIEGTVTVRLLIDESGRVEDVEVLDGAPAFRAAVLEVAPIWRFTPAREQGRPVKVWGIKRVRFYIERGGSP